MFIHNLYKNIINPRHNLIPNNLTPKKLAKSRHNSVLNHFYKFTINYNNILLFLLLKIITT